MQDEPRQRNDPPEQHRSPLDQERFEMLWHLALDGDESAIAGLWHEFQFDFQSGSSDR